MNKIRISLPSNRLAVREYIALTKPELTLLSVLTAVGAAHIASNGIATSWGVIHTAIGTLSVGSGAGVLNQYLERNYDALMKRTEKRPIPSGSLRANDALMFGLILSLFGVFYLGISTNAVAATLALLTLMSYLLLYTPLKRRTPFATIVGGIPGALPPLIGWSAVRGSVSVEGWSLFFILFFWQMPHFLSLAWMYRNDYQRAGFKLMTTVDPTGRMTPRQILIYSIALVPAALMPTVIGLMNRMYFIGALFISLGFLLIVVQFFRNHTNRNARRVFFASLVYLPAVFAFLLIG